MSLEDFVRKIKDAKSEDIDKIEELQEIFDQTKNNTEEVYMVSFSATE